MGTAATTRSTDGAHRRGSNRVFISYRRDDAAGYAGRLEGELERRLGHGSTFRDLQDISPGDDFVQVIRQRLAGAYGVVVLIGPRWAGGDPAGPRRIDDPHDFVRMEVQAALESGARVVPVLLPGATMPGEDQLPDGLKTLARRNALALADAHWAACVDQLIDSLGVARPRAVWPWAAGGAGVAALAVAALCWGPTLVGSGDADRLIGRWQAEVRYDWGDRYTERLEFTRHAGELTGTVGYLGIPRPVEQLQLNGRNLSFQTRSRETVGSDERETTHAYTAELQGQPPDEVLSIRLQTTGGFGNHPPLQFEAQRAPVAAAPSGPSGPR
jgi:hypothetical protein